MIICRSPAEIDKIRRAGAIVARALARARELCEPGISTADIDLEIENLIRHEGGRPAFKGYRGYPASTCISIDEQVVHGIPDSRSLASGQLVSVDIGVEIDGYFGDAARTFAVGEVTEAARSLIDAGKEALAVAIDGMRPDNHLYDLSEMIERVALSHGYSVVRDYVGHGIGSSMHEDPQIPNYKQSMSGPKLEPGMVFALEPMINAGGWQVEVEADEWTVVTKDKSLSVHFEDTIAVTKTGPVVLTKI